MSRLFTTTASSEEAEDTTSGGNANEAAASDREHAPGDTGGDDTGTVKDADSDTTRDVAEAGSDDSTGSSEEEDVVAIDLYATNPDTNPVEDVENRDDPEPDAGQEVEEPEQPANWEDTYPDKPRASYLPSEMRAGVEDEGASPASTLTAEHIADAARRIAACDQQARTLIDDNEHARLLFERAGSEPGYVYAIPVMIWRQLARSTLYPNEKRAARNAHARAAVKIAEKAEQTPAWAAAADVDADALATVLESDDWAVLVL
jgi:hypothetical protein